MAHVMMKDNNPNSLTKGNTISIPVTIIECPVIKIASSRFYKKTIYGKKIISEIFSENIDNSLKKRINIPKKQKITAPSIESFDEVRILVHTLPTRLNMEKKVPDLMEIPIGGTKEDQIKFIKEKEGKELTIESVFEDNEYKLDIGLFSIKATRKEFSRSISLLVNAVICKLLFVIEALSLFIFRR